MIAKLSTCALCPRLCRPACPVATGSAREAAVPTFLARIAVDFERGLVEAELAEAALTLCADCGACEDHCHISHPLPELLRDARRRVAVERPFEPLRAIEGDAEVVAIEVDERPLASVVARLLKRDVARWPTHDRFGVLSIDTGDWTRRVDELRRAASGRDLVVADGGVARALDRATIPFRWLHEISEAGSSCTGSCATKTPRPLACCGGGGPLAHHHPADAKRVAMAFVERWDGATLADSRCREHLRTSGFTASDLLDVLLETS